MMAERLVVVTLRAGSELPGWRAGEWREVPASEAAALLQHPELTAAPQPLLSPSPCLQR